MFDIAVLGFGVVGSGVVEVIDGNSDRVTRSAACEIRVKYIVDVRDFSDSPYKELVIKDFAIVEKDPDIRAVVETIGGVGAAYDFTKRSMLAGKSVITSNKELVAAHGQELLELARERGVNYLFEASVGGGIPILRPISQCLAANRLNEIYGILNGTTNYILTEMIKNGLSFEDALAQAKAKGYAEANPSADVDGHDACRKICILSALCFGFHVYPEQVETEGIRGVTLEDVAAARRIGGKFKLLGRGLTFADGRVSAYVAPHLIDRENMLAGVEGVMNGIVVRGNAIGDVMFYGAGAGKLPTASAVVADVIDAAKHVYSRKYLGWDANKPDMIVPASELKTKWYVRAGASAQAAAFGEVRVISGPEDGGLAFITEKMDKYKAEALAKKIGALSLFRVLE